MASTSTGHVFSNGLLQWLLSPLHLNSVIPALENLLTSVHVPLRVNALILFLLTRDGHINR